MVRCRTSVREVNVTKSLSWRIVVVVRSIQDSGLRQRYKNAKEKAEHKETNATHTDADNLTKTHWESEVYIHRKKGHNETGG